MELLDPAVKGTLNVLATAKNSGVMRVVHTSSKSLICHRAFFLQESSLVNMVVWSKLGVVPLQLCCQLNCEASRSSLAEASLHVVLILIYYRTCISVDYVKDKSLNSSSESLPNEETYFSENPLCKVLESSLDVEFDRVNIEGNAHTGSVVRLPFASLFDTLGMDNNSDVYFYHRHS